jgi:hypothetical protein
MPQLRDSKGARDSAGATERRRERSDDTLVALSRLLDAARRNGGLEALVLADDMGLAIAGAGLAADCDELAARAPRLATSPPANDTIPCRLDVVARTTRVRKLRIDGIEVLLCAEGCTDENERPLGEAVSGCERILNRHGR